MPMRVTTSLYGPWATLCFQGFHLQTQRGHASSTENFHQVGFLRSITLWWLAKPYLAVLSLTVTLEKENSAKCLSLGPGKLNHAIGRNLFLPVWQKTHKRGGGGGGEPYVRYWRCPLRSSEFLFSYLIGFQYFNQALAIFPPTIKDGN